MTRSPGERAPHPSTPHCWAFYRVLGENGWTQREIAKAAKTQQSGVSEILTGRRVSGYRVLVRIADGLGIPRELMNLSDGAYPGGVTATDLPEEVSAEMRRRVLVAAGMVVAGRPLQEIGELTAPPVAGAAAVADLRGSCGEGACSGRTARSPA